METCKGCGYTLAVAVISFLVFVASVQAETRVEASFTENPIAVNYNTVFLCRVFELSPDQQVGINGATVFVRNSELLQSAPDNILLNVFPSQPDGSTLYELTIEGVALEDTGPYSCVVLTVAGMVMAVATDSATLEVLDIYLPPDGYPKCSLSENRLSYYAGEEVILSCYSLDGKPSITLLWTRDNMPLSENQTLSEEGDLIFKNMSILLKETDNGVVFKCMIVSLEFPSNGRECSIGPIAVWPASITTTSAVLYNTTDNFDPRLIAGLTLPIFVMIIVGLGLFVLIVIILVGIFCARAYHCTCILHKRSYSMHGLKNSDTLQEGTLRVEPQYTPTRPAPVVPPPTKIKTNPESMSVQPRYTPNKETAGAKRLSVIESALLMAVSKSVVRERAPIQEENGSEIIYANTSRPSSVIEMQILSQDDEEDQEDSDSGVVNPAYAADNEPPSGNYTSNVMRPSSVSAELSRSRSASQSEIIYHNTAELSINIGAEDQEADQDLPEYAQVDKSRSRSSTMDSIIRRGTVEPESVTTLDDSIIYHNTAELAIIPSVPQSPPPVPANPPSPVTAKKPQYKRQISSVSIGGPEKPAFKPPPPPTPTSPSALSNPFNDNSVIGEEPEVRVSAKPKIAPKPAPGPKPTPPKKPTYLI